MTALGPPPTLTSFTKLPCDEAAALAAPASAPCTPAAAPWILAATILASSMAFIDGTVANIALPALQREFNATVFDAQWVIESFALFLSALLLVGGAAGDRFGRRRVFAIGVALFTAASVWCGLASSIQQLIVARSVQGIGGALLVPGSLAIISASFAVAERGRAIGIWSGYGAITTAIGPVLGGYLIDHLSWRYAFFINLPIGAAVLALTYWHVPESRSPTAGASVDWAGSALARPRMRTMSGRMVRVMGSASPQKLNCAPTMTRSVRDLSAPASSASVRSSGRAKRLPSTW